MQIVKSIASKNFVQHKNINLMGTPFQMSVVTTDAYWAESRIKSAIAEIKRIDLLLSTLRADSQANQINHNAGIAPVKISGELYRLVERSLKISELTQGAFDITYGANFSYDKVILNATNSTIYLKEKGMRIYFGGIARGYAIDRARYILQMEGVSSGVINAGNILTTWGLQANGQDWTIGAADKDQVVKPYADFGISNMAIALAGNTHNINNVSSINSVCVMGASAELAGAMTAPLMLLGIKTGIELVNKLQQLACVFVDESNHMFASKYMDALN